MFTKPYRVAFSLFYALYGLIIVALVVTGAGSALLFIPNFISLLLAFTCTVVSISLFLSKKWSLLLSKIVSVLTFIIWLIFLIALWGIGGWPNSNFMSLLPFFLISTLFLLTNISVSIYINRTKYHET